MLLLSSLGDGARLNFGEGGKKKAGNEMSTQETEQAGHGPCSPGHSLASDDLAEVGAVITCLGEDGRTGQWVRL